MTGEAMSKPLLARVVVDHADDEMQLNVRRRLFGAGFQKSAGLGEIRRPHAEAGFPVEADLLQQSLGTGERGPEEIRVLRLMDEDVVDVILQITPDARQM